METPSLPTPFGPFVPSGRTFRWTVRIATALSAQSIALPALHLSPQRVSSNAPPAAPLYTVGPRASENTGASTRRNARALQLRPTHAISRQRKQVMLVPSATFGFV